MNAGRKAEQLSFLEGAAPPLFPPRVRTAPAKPRKRRAAAEITIVADDLPESLRDLAELIGIEAVVALCSTFGGTGLHVPAKPARAGALTRALGLLPATLLCRRHGGEKLYVPMLDRALRRYRHRAIREAYDLGDISVKQLARRFGLSDRQVNSILKGTL
jgi:hypothetical protein